MAPAGGGGGLRLVSSDGRLEPGDLGPFARLLPTKQRVTGHVMLTLLGSGDLPVENQVQKLFVSAYPLIETIPRLDAALLGRISSQRAGGAESREFVHGRLEANRDQAAWYLDWCRCFGVPARALQESKTPAPLEAVVHYLWSVTARETVGVGLASLHVGVEWALGQLAARMRQGVDFYRRHPKVSFEPRVLSWLRTQRYGPDLHRRSMGVVGALCEGRGELERAIDSVERTIEYFLILLDGAMQPPFPRWRDL